MEIPYFYIHVESYVWQKDLTYINFLQGIPAPIVALGNMIKVFLWDVGQNVVTWRIGL